MQGEPSLSDIRARSTSTNLLAYVDLQTQMVLAADAEVVPMQEQLNELAATASDIFCGQDARRIAEVLGWSGVMSKVVLQDVSTTSAFVRGQAEGDDATCAIGTATADVGELLETAISSLRSLGHADN